MTRCGPDFHVGAFFRLANPGGNATGINFFAVADDAQGETVRWTASIWHAR